MAFGFLPVFSILSAIALSKSCGSMFQVSFSLSTNTGFAPKYLIGLLEAQNVKVCTITSSPAFTSQSIKARCTAAVPALNATTSLF